MKVTDEEIVKTIRACADVLLKPDLYLLADDIESNGIEQPCGEAVGYWLCCGCKDPKHDIKCTVAKEGRIDLVRYGTAKEHSDWQKSTAQPSIDALIAEIDAVVTCAETAVDGDTGDTYYIGEAYPKEDVLRILDKYRGQK